jgi:SAM-dependent methyltransferase
MEKNYKFTTDWFEFVKTGWDRLFNWYVNEEGNRIKNVLEIGCFEGRATTYLCEEYLENGTNYHVVDTFGGSEAENVHQDFIKQINDGDDFIFNNFTHNISHFPDINFKVERETSQHILPVLEREGNKYDFIYVDASHQADDTFVDAYWAHKMLNEGGMIIFDDYGWQEPGKTKPIQSPKFGIQAFLTLYQDEYDMVAEGYQIAIMKRVKTKPIVIEGNVNKINK